MQRPPQGIYGGGGDLIAVFPLKVVNSPSLYISLHSGSWTTHQEKEANFTISLTCSYISRFWANLFLWDFGTVSWLRKGRTTWGLVFTFVILFVCCNLLLNFLSHWMGGKYPGQVSPSLIIVPLKHSHIQFIFKTMYWVSTLPHTLLGDKEGEWQGSLSPRSSVANLGDTCLFTIQCDESLDVNVYSSTEKLRGWPLTLRRLNKQRLSEGVCIHKYQKIKKRNCKTNSQNN